MNETNTVMKLPFYIFYRSLKPLIFLKITTSIGSLRTVSSSILTLISKYHTSKEASKQVLFILFYFTVAPLFHQRCAVLFLNLKVYQAPLVFHTPIRPNRVKQLIISHFFYLPLSWAKRNPLCICLVSLLRWVSDP